MKTLVTGVTGLLGNNLARALLDRGHEVRVLVRPGGDPRPLEGLRVEIFHGDVRQAEAVQRACDGVDHVMHSAATVHIGWTGLEAMRAVNVAGTAIVAGAARAAGARMVHVSSVDALGIRTRANPADEETPPGGNVPCGYPITKREAEQAVLSEVGKGLDAVIVNPGYMLGPWDWKPSSGQMLLAVAKGQGLFAPPGGNDFLDVRDVAAGAIAALEQGRTGRRYILGGEPMSYLEAWTLFAQVTGGRRPLLETPAWLVMLTGRLGDLWGKVTGKEPQINSAATGISLLPHHFSYARARAELGYQPRPAVEGVEAAWAWFKDYGYVGRR